MKIVYNSKEISNSTDNYNSLLNLPMINSSTLQGVKTLNDINAYSKQQVDELIGNSRAIEIVTALPTNLIENTLYYVGPDANDFYDVYLVDEVRNVINIGTSQFGEYFGSTGIEIDDDNYIHAKIDNKTIIVDSEGNLHANLSIDTVPNFIGASGTAAGVKGLVPTPGIGDRNRYLKGDGVWTSIFDTFRPVGSIYLGLSSSQDPNVLFPGTTWTRLSTNRALWVSADVTTNLSAALPNITSTMNAWGSGSTRWGEVGVVSGAFSKSINTSGAYTAVGWVQESGNFSVCFDASRGTYTTSGTLMTQAQSPYGKSTTVQPPAIKICAWQRTA